MKKYNISNYIRYKEDVKESQPVSSDFIEYSRNDIINKTILDIKKI